MLVADAVAPVLVLWVMIGLLAVVLLVRLMLILVAWARLNEPGMLSAVHHDVLTLLMTLVVHCIRIVRRGLGYRRARRRRGVIGIAASATVYRGARSSNVTWMVVLLTILVIIEWTGSREPVCSIRHLTRSTQKRQRILACVPICGGDGGLA